MTWFKVDDKFHSHSKVRKVLADDPAALALWVVAGSWSSDNLTDGLIPDHQLPWLLPSGADELALKLVTARLWRRVRGGYQFHEWSTNGDGVRRNPTREEVEDDRRKKAEAGRKGGLASGKTRSKAEARGSAGATARAKAPAVQVLEPPTRPDPTFIGGRSTYVANGGTREEPPPRCPEHLEEPAAGPCGPCGSARRARQQYDRDQAAAEARRIADAPRCRKHRGQLAETCGPCRSERLAREEP